MLNFSENIPEPILDTLKSCFERTEGMVSFAEALLLYRLAKAVQSGCIIEVGSYRGRSTVFLGRGSLDGNHPQIYAIDPHENYVGVLGGKFGPRDRTAFYQAMLATGCSEIVSLINLSSEMFAFGWRKCVSLLWIDGDHSYQGVKRDFGCWSPHLSKDAFIAFDDATDKNLGPRNLISELTSSGKFEEVFAVGKIVVIRKCIVDTIIKSDDEI